MVLVWLILSDLFPQFSPSVWPHNPATGFWPPSATVVSAEPFSHRTGTLWCLQKEMATYRHRSVSLWRDPDDVSHCRILSSDKTEWRFISATLCGWRCCFMADQLWLMKRIWEKKWPLTQISRSWYHSTTRQITQWYQIQLQLQWWTNRKSYMPYRTAVFSMTLNNP